MRVVVGRRGFLFRFDRAPLRKCRHAFISFVLTSLFATLVILGETVVYRLDFINDEDEPVTDMVLTMPVPAEVTLQDGSADQDGVDTYFFADGGQTFSRRADLMVATDDSTMASATAADDTHIRWMSVDPVTADARIIAVQGCFEVRLSFPDMWLDDLGLYRRLKTYCSETP